MFRGFLSGIVSGILVGGIVMAVVSLMGPPPIGREPPQEPQVSAPTEAGNGATEASADAPEAPDLASAPAIGATPLVTAPDTDSAASAETAPGQAPAAVGVEGALDAPAQTSQPQPAATADAPVVSGSTMAAPDVPLTEGAPSISTVPAAAPTAGQTTAVAPTAPPAGAETGAEGVALDTPPLPAPTPMGVQSAAPDAAPTADAGAIAPPAVQDSVAVAPEAAPQPATPEAVVIAPERPSVGLSGTPATSMPASDPNITIRRADGQNASDTDAPPVIEEPASLALERYASDFAPTARPLMSIVLLDQGTMAGGPDALAAAGVPVTIAIDPTLSGATGLMTAYRDRGIEVLAVVDLPFGAQPSDVEVALQAVFLALPETIGVLDVTGAGVPETTAVQSQLMGHLKTDGRGFVTLSRGLNSSIRAADSAGVPNAVLYRDLDGQGQDARVIRRFLDQAAFRARQESGIVLLGRVRPETISALILWSTANRSSDTAQAPVSAILLSN